MHYCNHPESKNRMRESPAILLCILCFISWSIIFTSCDDEPEADSGDDVTDGDDDHVDDDDDDDNDDDNDNDDDDESGMLHLHVEDGRIVDSKGGTIILRGVGVNQLGDYFQGNPEILPTLPLEKRDFEQMEALGLNSVRLVISWSFLEPQRGVHDENYIAQIKEAVEWAKESNIYVILDMHQDAWGKYIATPPDVECTAPFSPNVGWDGAPEWATITDGLDTCMLETRELSPAVMRAWQSFWEDREGIQQHFIDTWARLATEFKGDPVIAGYNILNEPNWGEHYFDAVNIYLPDMHRRCLEAIRQVEGDDHHKIIFFEPSALWSFYPWQKPVPFTDDPDIVYAPHIYNSINGFLDDFLGYDLVSFEMNFSNAAAEAQGYGCPFWFGEWWGSNRERAGRIAALEDTYQIGSARWIWKVSCGDPHIMTGCWPECEGLREFTQGSTLNIQCGDPAHPEGVEMGYHPTDAVILARPYPRSYPSPAAYEVNPDEKSIEMQGDSPGDIPLVLWVPGEEEPVFESTNVSVPEISKVPGGWILTAEPNAGHWSFRAEGF